VVQDDPLIGAVIDGRYAITASLGRGGMATVYRARDKRLERDVAVKLMHPHLAQQADFTERFSKEARAAAQLSNPHVVAVYDRGVWASPNGAHAYLVMEFVPGPDLRSELNRLGSFNLGTALALTEQVLRALAAAHSADIVHRDVKPENVLLTAPLPPASVFERPEIHAEVADFGLARALDATTTASGVMMGTIAYVAPEVITTGHATAAADVYAAGIMLYEFLTGSLPFTAETPIATAYMHVNSPMPRVATQAPWLPPAVDSLIGLLTAKDPSDRPSDGTAAVKALVDVAASIADEDLIRRIPVIPRVPTPAEAPSSPAADTAERPAGGTDPLPRQPTQQLTVAATTQLAAQSGPDRAKKARRVKDDDAAIDAAISDAAAEPRTRRRRRWPWALLLLVVVLASATAWYFFLGPGKRVTVPNVVGQSYEQAESTLARHELTAERHEAYSDEVEAGVVISTDPEAGERTDPADPVRVTVSLGIEQVEVPDLSGKTEEEAQQELSSSRLSMERAEAYSETVPAGSVIEQGTSPGELVNHDSTIAVTISLGREPISVPSVVGLSDSDATEQIQAAGLTTQVVQQYSETVEEGEVIAQDPADGTLYRGDTVTITVSLGPELIEVPNVVGKSTSEATRILEEAGFEVNVEMILGGYFATVRAQDPGAGEQVRRGTTITLTVV